MSYYKKQKKHMHSIYLNSDDALYVDEERKTFRFKIPPINIEDESKLYVKNTIIDYKTSGLSVKNVNMEYISNTALSTTYNAPPSITFTPQDGKGTGATAVGVLEAVGLSASATSASTALGVVSGGAGYAGTNTSYISTFTSATGSGASILPTTNSATATSTLPTEIIVVGTTAGTIGTTDRWISFPYSGAGATFDYTFTTTQELLCNILIVGGGGGGGSGRGGGGGGGGVLFEENVILPIGTYIAKVGKGGASVAVSAASSTGRGGTSSLFYNGIELYRVAGGGGGASFASSLNGDTGASGGGGHSGQATTTGLGGVASSTLNIPNALLGNNGGAGIFGTGAGGGGGGQLTAGSNSSAGVGGNGAGGRVMTTSGTNLNYGSGGGGGALEPGTAGAGGTSAGSGGVLAVGGNGTNGLGAGGGGGGRNASGTTNYAGGTGGSGIIFIKYTLAVSSSGSITSGTLTTGSGYTEVPTIITAPPPDEPAIFSGSVGFNSGGGYILTLPTISNPTTNGFYNPLTFRATFINNPIIAEGFCSTNASGTLTNIIISNGSNNGYYRFFDCPCEIVAINGVLLGSGGTGLIYTMVYSNSRATSVIITNGGTGYGANLVDAPVLFSLPGTPLPASINAKIITDGRLQSITLGNRGERYRNPTIVITSGRITPATAVYNPVYLSQPKLRGVKMLTNGRGYSKPPIVSVSQANVSVSNGDMPLTADMTQSYLVEPNLVYTIKAEGFSFNRTLYTNTDNRGRPTIAITSPNEIINDEEYGELILPAQVINELTLTITERDGSGLDANRNLSMLLSIEELDEVDTEYIDSKREALHD